MAISDPHPTESVPSAPASGTGDVLCELMTRVARGEETAFAALYDTAAPQVFGLVRSVVRDPVESEEVAHKVMVEVWRTAGRYQPGQGSVTAWLTATAHRHAVEWIRSEPPAHNRSRRPMAGDVHAGGVAGQVRDCLDRLQEWQRESLRLAFYNGYTYPEIATLLAVSRVTVRAGIRDGLRRLSHQPA